MKWEIYALCITDHPIQLSNEISLHHLQATILVSAKQCCAWQVLHIVLTLIIELFTFDITMSLLRTTNDSFPSSEKKKLSL